MINDSSKSQVVIDVKKFSKKYFRNNVFSVKNANFQVLKGQLHGFIGANGAGKTTTIKSIIGAYAKYDGQVSIFGIKNTKKSAKKYLGYIPEKAEFPKGFSIYSYLKNMMVLSGFGLRKASKISHEKIKELGLESLKHKNPSSLSSGQKKKVLLAQALVHDPKIIVMDEPAANLDPKSRVDFFETILELNKKGVTIFISSHILDELDKYIDSVTIIDNGTILFSGKIENAINNNSNNDNWIIKTNDNEKLKLIMKELNISIKINYNNLQFSTSHSNFVKLINQIFKNELKILMLKNDGSDLTSIYEKYVTSGKSNLVGKK